MKFEIGQVWIARNKSKWRILATDAPDSQYTGAVIAMDLSDGCPTRFHACGSYNLDSRSEWDLLTLDRPRREWTLEYSMHRGEIAVARGPEIAKGEVVTVVEKLEGEE